MKKVLLTGAALMLVGSMAAADATYAAEPGVTITGNARVRFWYQSEDSNTNDFGNDTRNFDSQTNMDSRVRLDITGTAAGGAYAKARIRMMESFMGDNDTDSAGSYAGGSNVWVDKAYVGIPFSDTFTLELGKYRSTYGPLKATYNFFYDDVHLTGAKGIIKMDNVTINPFIEWMEEAQGDYNNTTPTGDSNMRLDNDEVRFGVHVQAKLNKDWSMGGMLGYQVDARNEQINAFEPNEGFFGSIYAKGQSGQFGIVGEFAVTDNDLNNFNAWENDTNVITATTPDTIGSDDTGFGGYIFPNYQIDKLNIGLNLGFTTGGFTPDRAFGFVMLGGTDNSRISQIRIGDTGDWLWAGLVTSYQIAEDLKLTGNIVYADVDAWNTVGINGDGPNTVAADCDLPLESALELSAVLQYTISKGADVYFSAGYLKPEFDVVGAEEDGSFAALTRFELAF